MTTCARFRQNDAHVFCACHFLANLAFLVAGTIPGDFMMPFSVGGAIRCPLLGSGAIFGPTPMSCCMAGALLGEPLVPSCVAGAMLGQVAG